MIEVLWIGRGGQGAFTAAKLLGAAYALKGEHYHALAFPAFGPERRGAPIKAFSKLDHKPILDRSQTEKADYIVILDDTLYNESFKQMLKPNGKVIVSSKHLKDSDLVIYNGEHLAGVAHLPTVNTIMLGVLAAKSNLVTKEDLFQAVEDYMQEKIQDKNKEVISQVLEEISDETLFKR